MDNLLERTPDGLYCAAGDFYIDPWNPVARAVITHERPNALPRSELRRLIKDSYDMVAAKLPKKVRVKLGLAVSSLTS